MTEPEALRAIHKAADRSRERALLARHVEARRLLLVAAHYYDDAAVGLIRAEQAEADAASYEPPTAAGY